jgi:hypothetical protein
MANPEANWKKETVKAAVPVVLLWASAATILWVAISQGKKQNEAPLSAPRAWKLY